MPFSAILIGQESLTIQCGMQLIEGKHTLAAVVSADPAVCAWAEGEGLLVLAPGADLADRLPDRYVDWLISAANLSLIPQTVLDRAMRGAVNFHDGPLPRYAGLNAPVWAMLNGERTHGVTWHLIEGSVDAGGIIAERTFEIGADDTALSLNAKCYAAGIESFADVLLQLGSAEPRAEPQVTDGRQLYLRSDRPANAALINFDRTSAEVVRFVRALDHGSYPNPLALPKVSLGDDVYVVREAKVAAGAGPIGQVLKAEPDRLTVATADGAVELTGLSPAVRLDGFKVGQVVDAPVASLSDIVHDAAIAEPDYRAVFESASPVALALPGIGGSEISISGDETEILSAVAKVCGQNCYVAVSVPSQAPGFVTDWAPLALGELDRIHEVRERGGFAADLSLRLPDIEVRCPDIAIGTEGPVAGAVITLVTEGDSVRLIPDPDRIGIDGVAILAGRIRHAMRDGEGMPEAELRNVITNWNQTEADFDEDLCIHHQIELQAVATPDAIAVVFEDQRLTYAELIARSNAVAHVLQDMGAGPEARVGVYCERSIEMLVGALGVLKAGAAYVPLDPTYPADRIALYVEDSGAEIVVTNAASAAGLDGMEVQTLVLDRDPRISAAPDAPCPSGAEPENLAYLIYTSGSTGKPKGVMVEHRNVANFFAGMDERVVQDEQGTWLAVTSLSFDISVLELFYTLSRGFKLVIASDAARTLQIASMPQAGGGEMDFSVYYWGNDDGVGSDKYRLLLEGAKFADANGFCAVWTPERHFHAFGGPYPNPSVTGAAVAAVTKQIGVRAGSCVAPLHHPARIAEEWAVIDNLTNGRAGLAIASGWQPDDFVLRPENTPPHNKPAMLETIDVLRKLWAGTAVAFPKADGTMHDVITQPRPVSNALPVWVTTAGNPETWKEAGRIGANVLTHLLGQSITEVEEKIALYHQALRESRRNPKDFTVTLMLHTYLADTRDEAREVAREPMKDYLRSAAGLIKQYAWAFPAFKKPKGAASAMELDLGSLSEDELESILDFAFERYFNDSGLFGTVEDAVERVEGLKSIGVSEVACLIDYGIETDAVMGSLARVAQVIGLTNPSSAMRDYSIAGLVASEGVTHMQCTPSMAQLMLAHEETRPALAAVQHLLLGGEALPGSLVTELGSVSDATIENMYGPTETTIWSTTRTAEPGDGITGIGRPIANTQVYVLDDKMDPVPVGAEGELWIGGAGVTRGYWMREDLTQDRFRPNPFAPGRIYGTGDVVRWRADGTLDFVGRADHQVKLRGFRIELGEIEAVIDALPGVRQSVVVARGDDGAAPTLVAYVVGSAPEAELRSAITAVLPAHMVPQRFVVLDAFPLTPNGKVDRKALPAPDIVRAVSDAPPAKADAGKATTPDTAEETLREVAAVWQKILGVEGIQPGDNFFDLGGHSLLAVQVHRELRDGLDAAKLGVTDIFRFPVLRDLAAKVALVRTNAPIMRVAAPVTETGVKAPPVMDVAPRAMQRTEAMAQRRALRAKRAARR